MDAAIYLALAKEFAADLTGRKVGRVFSFNKYSFAIDVLPHAGRYIFVDISSQKRRAYLISRKLKEIERRSVTPSAEIHRLSQMIASQTVTDIDLVGPSALRFKLSGDDLPAAMIVELGGRLPNIYLLDGETNIIYSLRKDDTDRLLIGDKFQAAEADRRSLSLSGDDSISASLDAHFLTIDKAERFETLVNNARRRIRSQMDKQQKLLTNLQNDLEKHGDAERWKRSGDILLANIATAKLVGDEFEAVDYFDENVPTIKLDALECSSPKDAAEAYFKRYAKARNAAIKLKERIGAAEDSIRSSRETLAQIDDAALNNDLDLLERYQPKQQHLAPQKKKKDAAAGFNGARKFISSDGIEILVGKGAADNDKLTFRVSRSLDLWLHAADYPGSHVIIRLAGKRETPQQTLIEAASLAAFYSDARGQHKAAVNYTQRKFVSKQKGAAAGLVSIAGHRTIMVTPEVPDGITRG